MTTETELRNAGASELFISYWHQAPKNASVIREIEEGPFDLGDLAGGPDLGGHFFEALWVGDKQGAFARADSRNLAVLERATGQARYEVLQ